MRGIGLVVIERQHPWPQTRSPPLVDFHQAVFFRGGGEQSTAQTKFHNSSPNCFPRLRENQRQNPQAFPGAVGVLGGYGNRCLREGRKTTGPHPRALTPAVGPIPRRTAQPAVLRDHRLALHSGPREVGRWPPTTTHFPLQIQGRSFFLERKRKQIQVSSDRDGEVERPSDAWFRTIQEEGRSLITRCPRETRGSCIFVRRRVDTRG